MGGERVDFLHFNNKETGPERWSDLSKVTQLLRGGDKLRLARAAWLRGGGRRGLQREITEAGRMRSMFLSNAW